VIYALILLAAAIFAGPYEAPQESTDVENRPRTPSIKGVARYSLGSVYSQDTVVEEKTRSNRLNKPKPLQFVGEVLRSPALDDRSWNLSPRARDHYARMGAETASPGRQTFVFLLRDCL
jgi:hypothetical protein